MLQALGHLLPIAVAVALSSVPITATIVILISPKRNRAAIPFLVGWVFGIALVISLVSLFAQALPEQSVKEPTLAIGIVEIVLGVAMIVFSFITWRRARGKPPAADDPKWLRAIGSFGALPAFGIAFALNFRPKGLLLGIAAGLGLHTAGIDPAEAAVAIAIYTVIGASTVAAPIIVTLAAPQKMQPRLLSARSWITRNSRIVTVLIMLMIGVVILGSGLTDL
ncbi:GAP family protein [Subtercola endophyticus]|uniref:GAP family protein n=1 Tax=Subtercola endophyticus TaxID=2895559 RepID=UPI001E609963|nr:GAP family protein [Subtercola endophyticus]UFS60434.1 GAP family protein [Subtercola endophyticus]